MLTTLSFSQSLEVLVMCETLEWVCGEGREAVYCVGVPPKLIPPPLPVDVITDYTVSEWLKFRRLLGQWQSERGATSSITEMAACPAYQGIIGMGPTAIPLIVSQLRLEGDEPDQWFWALKAITGVDPVGDEDRGNYPQMAKVWLQWAANNGYGW